MKTNTNSGDNKLIVAILFFFVAIPVKNLFSAYFTLYNTETLEWIDLGMRIAAVPLFLRCIPIVLEKKLFLTVCLYSLTLIYFCIYYYIYQSTGLFLSIIPQMLLINIPMLLVALCITDYLALLVAMKKVANILFVICLIYLLLISLNMLDIYVYNMSLGYSLLFPALFFLHEYFTEARWIHIFKVLIVAFVILTLGSRGPLAFIALYVILMFFVGPKVNGIKEFALRFLSYSLFVTLIIFSLIYTKNIFDMLERITTILGVESRTLLLLANNMSFELSGRDEIFNTTIGLIKQHAYLGYGMGGTKGIMGVYPHNLALEVLADFGVIFGILILLLLTAHIIYAFIKTDLFKKRIIIFWSCLGLFPLLISGTYTTEYPFWIFLGILGGTITGPKTIVRKLS